MCKKNKTINSKGFFAKLLAILMLGATLLQGCSGGLPGSAPQRNKMPEFADLSNGFEGSGCGFQTSHTKNNKEFGLTVSNVEMGFMGSRESCVSVALPSAADDSVAFNLVHSYGRFALPLLSEWSKRDRNGVVLDLREQQGISAVPHKAEYVVSCANNADIPVIFLWDQSSAQRANVYVQLLDQFTGVKYRLLSSN